MIQTQTTIIYLFLDDRFIFNSDVCQFDPQSPLLMEKSQCLMVQSQFCRGNCKHFLHLCVQQLAACCQAIQGLQRFRNVIAQDSDNSDRVKKCWKKDHESQGRKNKNTSCHVYPLITCWISILLMHPFMSTMISYQTWIDKYSQQPL